MSGHNENRQRLRELAEASTDGPVQYGAIDATVTEQGEQLSDWLERTGPNKQVWITWQDRGGPDNHYYLAITGNGPQSEANAAFFSVARANVLALIAEVEQLEAKLAMATMFPPRAGAKHTEQPPVPLPADQDVIRSGEVENSDPYPDDLPADVRVLR